MCVVNIEIVDDIQDRVQVTVRSKKNAQYIHGCVQTFTHLAAQRSSFHPVTFRLEEGFLKTITHCYFGRKCKEVVT